MPKTIYPQWTYFPRNANPPGWVNGVLEAVAAVESEISTVRKKGPTIRETGTNVRKKRALSSDEVLERLRPGLELLDFRVETGRTTIGRIKRPVLYGPNGKPSVYYFLDGFHEQLGIALEVEAGQGRANNNDYRDIVRSALILDVNFLVLAMPQIYRYHSNGKEIEGSDYESCIEIIDAIYTSNRIKLPYELLLVGY